MNCISKYFRFVFSATAILVSPYVYAVKVIADTCDDECLEFLSVISFGSDLILMLELVIFLFVTIYFIVKLFENR
jgi:hypothetical protein